MGLIFRLFGRLFSFLVLLAFLAVAVGAVLVLLVFLGNAKVESCRVSKGGEKTSVTRSDELAAAFQSKWDPFHEAVDRGGTPSVSLNEDEVSSRVAAYFAEHTSAVRELTICFEPGLGIGSASFSVLGASFSARVEGDISFEGEHPQVRITKVKAGALPSVGPIRAVLEDLINSQLDGLRDDHHYRVEFDYNRVTVSVSR